MIIVGLVLLYGYNAIKGFREKQEKVSLIETQKQIENTIKSMSSEYDSIKTERLQLPPNFKSICFVDKDYMGSSAAECPGITPDSEAIVKDAIQAGTANIFLVPDGTINYKIGNLQVSEGCICIKKTGSEAIFRIRGLGNGVEISEWQQN